jgi:hypothetical protein
MGCFSDIHTHTHTLSLSLSHTHTPSISRTQGAWESVVSLETLDVDERREIVRGILARYNKQLDAQQMHHLLNNSGSISPLWLAIACEELRVYGTCGWGVGGWVYVAVAFS